MGTNHLITFSWKKATLLSLSVGLLVAGLSAFVQTGQITAQAPPAQNQVAVLAATTSVPAEVVASGSGSSYSEDDQPERLVITSIGVNARVQSVGLHWRGDGTMGIPSNMTDVAWYNGGPSPGTPGNAVIAGHLDGKGVPEAVFYHLGSLKPGDLVEVTSKGGTAMQFRVVAIKTYDKDAPTTDIFIGDASKARLNLITCTGDWDASLKTYNKRVIVFTEMVSKES